MITVHHALSVFVEDAHLAQQRPEIAGRCLFGEDVVELFLVDQTEAIFRREAARVVSSCVEVRGRGNAGGEGGQARDIKLARK